jgi:hypothetical protein
VAPKINSNIILSCLVRAAVRFCVGRGIKIQEYVECLKTVFLEEAKIELERQNQEPTTSRLSLITGIQRREISRLNTSKNPEPKNISLATKVVGAWTSQPEYLGVNGKPRVLNFVGKDSEFSRLVRSISTDVSSYTVLNELERSETAERTNSGLKLIESGHSVNKDVVEGFKLIERDSIDLAASAQANIAAQTPLYHHIRTEYDNIPKQSLRKIRKWMLAKGREFHAQAREYLLDFDRDLSTNPGKGSDRTRVVISSFSFDEELNLKEDES